MPLRLDQRYAASSQNIVHIYKVTKYLCKLKHMLEYVLAVKVKCKGVNFGGKKDLLKDSAIPLTYRPLLDSLVHFIW